MASNRLRYNPDLSDAAFNFGDFGSQPTGSGSWFDKYKGYIAGLAVVGVVVFLVWVIYYKNKQTKRSASEKFYSGSYAYGLGAASGQGEVWMGAATAADGKGEVDSPAYADPATVFDQQKVGTPTYPRADRLTAEDLLPPKAVDSQWSQANPTGQGDVGNQNFLSAGHHVGTNTIGSSLRNPNLQLRSEPINPQQEVGPWMQSTIEPDMNRRPLEIGTAA